MNDYINIDQDVWDALEKIAKCKTINKDEYLSKIYENQRQIGFVVDGIVRVYHLDEEGTEYNKSFFVKNDLFMTSLDGQEDSAVFVQAVTNGAVIMFGYDAYMKLSLQYEVLEKVLNRILLDYMTRKQQREIELLSLDARDRYIRFVKNNPALSEKLPQFHIASYLGITPTQLSRIKKQLNNQHM